MLRLGQVFEPVPTEISQFDARGQTLLDQSSGRLGDQDLPAVADGRDSGGAVDVQADIGSVANQSLAGVQPHSDPNRGVAGPLLSRQRALCLNGRFQCPGGAAEGGE